MASMEISLDNVTSVAEFIDFLLDKDIFKERDVLTMQYLLTSIDLPDLELKCIEYARKNRQALCYYKETTPNGNQNYLHYCISADSNICYFLALRNILVYFIITCT